MRLVLLLSLLLLSATHQQRFANAAETPAAPVKATVKQFDDSYGEGEPGESAYSPSDSKPEKQDYAIDDSLCPEPQPADAVKQAYAGHATFNWLYMAQQRLKSVSKVQMQSVPAEATADAWTAAHAARAAYTKDRSGRDAAKTAASDDANALLPSKLKELDGLLGTYDPAHYPSFEAFAAGPHPTDPDLVFMLHAVNSVAEMFLTEKDGTKTYLGKQTKVSLQDITALVPGFESGFEVLSVTGYYDPKAKRYVLVWTTTSNVAGKAPAVFVAVSQTRNPMGDWSVWALNLRPTLGAGMTFCSDQPAETYTFEFPQVSFSKDGVFIGGSNTCPTGLVDKPRSILTALYAFSKKALYARPPLTGTADIKAAVYLPSKAWYRSVSGTELHLVLDEFEPFNSIPTPARPQTVHDLESDPMFVIKVDNAHLSVATLAEEPCLDDMTSVDTAPKIKAVVVGKGDNYGSAEGYSDGNAIMPQPNTTTVLELAYLGMPTNYNAAVFWATVHQGMLHLATGEYWGYDTIRMPSIYWAILKVTDDLCKLSRKDHGLVASQDGLALAYPVIAARKEGGALLAFSYSGKGSIAGGQYPAYAGVATAMVGDGPDDKTVIHIIKKGVGSLDPFGGASPSIPWGIGSAAQVCGEQMWFAVPIPAPVNNVYSADLWYGSWISWQQL